MPKIEEVKPIPPDPGEEEMIAASEERESSAAIEMQQDEPKPAEGGEEDSGPPLERTSRRKPLRSSSKKPVKPFPAPATRFFHDEHQSAKGLPAEFFKYWRRICADPEFKQRVVVYIYRAWPAMLDGKRQVTKVYDEPMTPEDLIRQFGCGDYVLRLNDSGSNGLNVTNCSIRNLGARQLNEFPPVLNIQDLDFEDKSNQSYLLWARSRGMLTPEQERKIKDGTEARDEKQQQGEDMANAEAIKQLASTVDRITDKVITVANKEREENRGGSLPEKLLDLVTAASASATQSAAAIMQESVKQVLELQKQNSNPLQNLKEVAGTLKDLLPNVNEQSDALARLMEREKHFTDMIFQIQNERIKGLESLVEKMTSQQINHLPAAATPTAEKPKSAIESLRELAAVKDELREILGLDDKQEEPGWMKFAPFIAQGLGLLGTYFANAMHNLAVAKTGQGQPLPPPSPQEAAQQEAAGAKAPAAGPVQAPSQMQQQEQTIMDRFRIFFQMIERPLLLSFNNGESGADFAEKLIELTENGMFGPQTTGRQVYDSVLEYGQDVVNSMIKTYPPIWSVVSQTPQKWEKFLTEFFNADEIWAKEEAAETAIQPEAQEKPSGRGAKKTA